VTIALPHPYVLSPDGQHVENAQGVQANFDALALATARPSGVQGLGFASVGVVNVTFGAGSVESTATNLPAPAGGTSPVGCVATCNLYTGTGRVVAISAVIAAGVFQVNGESTSAFSAVVSTVVPVSYFQWWT